MSLADHKAVVDFWRSAGRKAWFTKDDAFDAQCRAFLPLHEAAARGALDDWTQGPESALALVLLLDQFPRNLFRGGARTFASDAKARTAAGAAIARGFDQAVEPALRLFFYLPFEHSEDIADQDESVRLFAAAGDAHDLRFAEIHRDIIRRFGRFPHRNAALGRTTTAEEAAFLAGGGFSG
ncbi:MAG: DUF924 family protein [Parvularculaceae bacterium]|nr:DUF924 family protein [Parvularculaceae bacterium]